MNFSPGLVPINLNLHLEDIALARSVILNEESLGPTIHSIILIKQSIT